jgi:prepilin-type N-terminal cleavage/methylation domain-containing protein
VLRTVRGRAGFTLVEALIALAMFSVVMLAVFAAADFTSKTAANVNERNLAVSEATTGVARMVADMRRAYQVNYPASPTKEASIMDLDVRVPGGGVKRVFYNCAYKESATYNECVRYESTVVGITAGTPPAGVAAVPIIRRVINETAADKPDPVFQKLAVAGDVKTGTEPTYGEIVLHITGKGEVSTSNYKHQLQLNDSFYLPNLDFGH